MRIVGVIVVAVIIGLIKFGIGFWASETDAETTSVGACMHNDGSDSNADLNEVDCSSSDAQYKVVKKFDDTSDDTKCEAVTAATVSYVQSGGGHDVVLCLSEIK
ncbi:LppU/SCO3897 family protein [Streptomyces adustus]|uniref:LppU/SCO3897 family protein n=1 Tax=Streptomyces adustus TaxID=1609272 RepID=UPI003712B267